MRVQQPVPTLNTPIHNSKLPRFLDWGLIDYNEALLKQKELVELRIANQIPNSIVFCRHPEVVTLGRATPDSDVEGWVGRKVETNRGGRATFHGPDQVVVYPILKIDEDGLPFFARDIRGYMRWLEQQVVLTLAELGVSSFGRQGQIENDRQEKVESTGIWWQKDSLAPPQKLASLGIAVRKWVTYHGVAINLKLPREKLGNLRPCGFQTEVLISLFEILGRVVTYEDLVPKVATTFVSAFSQPGQTRQSLHQ